MRSVTELIVAALPVLRRGLVPALVGSFLAVVVAAALGVGMVFAIEAFVPPRGSATYLSLAGSALCPVCLGLLVAGTAPAFALSLDGTPGVLGALREGARRLPTLVLLAVPGSFGLLVFASTILILVATAIAGPRSSLGVGPLIAMAVFVTALTPLTAYVWVRAFVGPVAVAVVERVGFRDAFVRSDVTIAKRGLLLTVSVLLPLFPLLVTLPDSIAARSVASFGISPAPLMAIRGTVAVLAFFASVLLSAALPIVAYALASDKLIPP